MKFWQKIPGKTKIILIGLNIEKFINYLISANISILRAKRPNYNRLELILSSKNGKKVIENAEKFGFKVRVEGVFGFYKIVDFFIKRFSIVVCLLFCISMYLFSNLFVWGVNIEGTINLSDEEIISFLEQSNVGIGRAKTHVDVNKIEKSLLNNFNQISLVSVYLYGNSINININEKLPQDYLKYEPILSQHDGVVKDFVLVSGTTIIKCGDVVREGDILVLPYIIDNAGNKKSIKPSANIVLEVDFSNTISYNENREILEDTGDKIVSTNISLFGLNFRKELPCHYSHYRVETREVYILNNLFLPIKKVEKTYYEQTYVSTFIAFESVKQDLINDAYDNVFAKAKDCEVINKNHSIVKSNDTYYITANCKAVVYIGERL